MDYTSYLVHWIWLGVLLVLLALLSPAAVLVGLVLWLSLHWKAQAQWRWAVAGMLLFLSWAGLVLLWDTLAGQLVALREAITGQAGIETLLTRVLPVWSEGTLLGPTIAGLVQLFRPPRLVRQQPAQPARSAHPKQPPLRDVAQQRTLPSPAVKADPPPDAPSEPSA